MNNSIASKQTFKQLAQRIESQMDQARRSHDLDHTLRVLRMAEHLGEIEKANLEIIRYAALLHDIARMDQDQAQGKIDHAQLGAEKARKIFTNHLTKTFFAGMII